MKKQISKTKKILSGLIILTAFLFIIIVLFIESKAPDYSGEVTVPSITSPVTVKRDSCGIPHIYAENAADAWFAYGYTLAQDRLFQMEVQRRVARGELAEIFGKSMLKYDRLFRTWLFKRTAEKYLKNTDRIDPKALAILDAWLKGINQFIEEDNLSVEFTILGLKPRPFTRVDSMSIMAYMAWSFADGFDTDSIATTVEATHGEKIARLLFPGYSLDKPVTIMETEAHFTPGEKTAAVTSPKGPITDSDFFTSSPVTSDLKALVAGMGGALAGSNSWVIAPSRSTSGGAILANDPHVALSNPAVWYEAHIVYPGYENYGYHAPLFPFPMMAHNRHKGWGITMYENDDLDLFLEKINPENPDMVMYRGAWTKMKVYKEKIKIKGGKEENITIRVTPHGPIMSEFLPGYEKKTVALWWVYHHEYNNILTFAFRAAEAKNLKEAAAAAKLLAAPGLNLSYADAKGNIAWWAAGKIPIRPGHTNHKRILDGASGRDEHRGYVSFEKSPHLINPASGIIVTANNMSTRLPLGEMKKLDGYWCPTDRADRITTLLRSKKKWSIKELKKVQTDLISASAGKNRDAMVKLISASGITMSPDETQALAILKNWNLVTDTASKGATVYNMLLYHILKSAVEDELGEKNFKNYCDTSDHWNALKGILANDASPLWDNVTTDKKETARDIALAALKKSAAELREKLGSNWQWGRLHYIEYRHPIGEAKPLNLYFNIGPLPAPGEAHLINRLKSKIGRHDYRVVSVPSHRRLIDYSSLESSISIMPSGNSGNPASPHYDDQVKRYLEGKYRPINFTPEQVKKDTVNVMMLLPEKNK